MPALNFLSITILLSIAPVAATPVAPEAQDQPASQQADLSVAVSYSLPKTHLTLHEPVILIFAVCNKTLDPAKLDLGQDRKSEFSFAAVDPNGTRLELPPLLREGIAPLGTISVAPGHTYSQKLVLNQWYAFPTPGRYQFEGHLITPILIGQDVERETDRGFRVAVEIGPRDETVLTKTCESLVKEIEASASNYQNAAFAALALGYVNDPLAEPYLRSVLFTSRKLERIIIEGLGRVGDGRSVDALARLAASSDLELKGSARLALFKIRQRTSDAQTRDEISRILGNP